MPIRDHFRPPVQRRLPWESLHSGWASRIAERLNELLPQRFVALEHVTVGGRIEIDVATSEEVDPPDGGGTGGVAVARSATWAPPAPAVTFEAAFPDTFEVRVFDLDDGHRLVAALELVSEGNKDRRAERKAFAAKCGGYLASGVSLVVLDVVTTRRANLHNETMRALGAPDDARLPGSPDLYAVAYRPVLRNEKPLIDLWTATFRIGDPLPTMPLRLTGDLFVPVEFEETYTETCRRRRLT